MAKKTQSKLENIVDSVVTRLEKAEKFVLEQSPDVCKEVIAEKLALLVLNITLSSLSSIGLVRLAFYLASFAESNQREAWPYVTAAGAVLLAILCICWLISSVESLISVRTAPKLTILRELRDLVSKKEEGE
jgi:hypothetical protein